MSVRSRGIDVDRELANDGPLCVDSNRSSDTTEGPFSAGSGPRAMTLRQLVAQHLRKGAVLVVGGFHLATDAHVRACATNNRNQ